MLEQLKKILEKGIEDAKQAAIDNEHMALLMQGKKEGFSETLNMIHLLESTSAEAVSEDSADDLKPSEG